MQAVSDDRGAIAAAAISVATNIALRGDVAMTGENTLRGRVLPIGGLKEKLLAAMRSGIKTVLVPKDNEKDLAEIPDNVKKAMEIIPVTSVEEVLAHALAGTMVPIDWDESDEEDAVPAAQSDGDEVLGGVVKH